MQHLVAWLARLYPTRCVALQRNVSATRGRRRLVLAGLGALLAPAACAPRPEVDWSGVRGWPRGDEPGAASVKVAWRGGPPPGRVEARHAPLECVPFARELSGVELVGDAWTWWEQGRGRYARGSRPEIGAVAAFRATEAMPLGHVAVVSRILSAREMRITHANWDGGLGKGMVDVDQPMRDLSARNDWSLVQVWHPATNDWGSGAHPLAGFILPSRPTTPAWLLAEVPAAHARAIREAERLVRLERAGLIERGGRSP